MADPALPEHARGEVFLDARGNGRAMRLSWHPEADMVVLSLWREKLCAGTFRMAQADVGMFIDTLIDGLRDAPGVHLPPHSAPDAPLAPPDAHATGETRVVPSPKGAPAFTDWAFDPRDLDGHATAS